MGGFALTIHPHGHYGCACPGCTFLDVYPVMPSLDPPDVNNLGTGDWQVWCNYLGPLIDDKATLIRRLLPTDGISIPRVAWRAIGHPFIMPMLAYALLHDAEYAAELFPRAECDSRFLEGMLTDGRINWATRNAVWSAVRMFGGGVWSKHTPESIADARKFCRVVGREEWYALRDAKHL